MGKADFSKPYDPKAVEPEIYKTWLDSGYFNPDNLPNRQPAGSSASRRARQNAKAFGGKNYIVYMPLPNVTGTLHMGHLLNNSLQDIIVRYRRMKGERALYLPGTDHAGIATQYMVEKQLKKEGVSRFDLGREKFIERVWKWKEEYGGLIINQLKRIGVSADWTRARFTMDPAYAKDVAAAFVHYYEKGLIYRGLRTVNWCPRCDTSLSDLELEHKEEKGTLWYIRYPLRDAKPRMHANAANGCITVATTRPETMLGDTAVAVNPKDKRYAALVGQNVKLPLTNREIPIIADAKIDLDFGTGALKVTPAHDVLDFEIGQRHKLETIQVIDERGKMNENAGRYAGMKTDEARAAVVQQLKERGFMAKEEPYVHNIAVCSRCGHVIEPIPSMQWFLKMDTLAKSALKAVKSGKVKIRPENFKKIYFDWLENVRDWTISRQLWWGHQLPVYFCRNKQEENPNAKILIPNSDKYVVALEKPKTCPFCKNCDMVQSPDVLDTWFSSALWPFAGFSEEDKKKYYPGNTLITARDIINLWVARMIFSGLEFMGQVPFNDVLIHGTILTKEGKRMSKSLGTGIDPLKYIDRFGADATRFAAVWQATGQDIRWDEAAAAAGRKFCNKIWNASRYVLENLSTRINADASGSMPIRNVSINQLDRQKSALTNADKEIISKLQKTKEQTEQLIDGFEFSKALQNLYDFFWHDFCDVYLEASKEQLKTGNSRLTTSSLLLKVLEESLKMLHPFMPFVTEAIWNEMPDKNGLLMVEKW